MNPTARQLLENARNLEAAADHLASGGSAFGRYRLPGVFPEQGLAAMYGASGSSKTFLAVHMALTIAAGLSWFGRPVQPGTVVYLASEDRGGVEARAVAAAAQMDGVTPAGLPLEFLSPPAVHSDDFATALVEALEELRRRNEMPIAAVFLDTLAAAFGGRSQDDAAQMTIAADRCQAIAERFGCLFVAMHHSGKDHDRGMRGSAVLKDRADTVLAIARAKSGVVTATVEKLRNGPAGAQFTFTLQPIEAAIGSRRIETCVVADLTENARHAAPATVPDDERGARTTPSRRKLPRDAQTALDVLKGLANGHGATIETWRSGVYAAFGERDADAKRQAFRAARLRLTEDGRISIEGTGETESVRSLP